MKIIQVAFYGDDGGKEPVREWLKKLGKPDSTIIGEDLKTVEFGWPIGMPTCRPLGGGLYEVRSEISSHRIARVLFCFADGYMVLLHGFIKKTQETPDKELKLARDRKRKVENG
jgi:Phage-related protein